MTTQERLFGTKLCPVNKKEMSRICGVSYGTMCNWAKNPDAITLGNFRLMVKLRGCSDGDIVKMVRERT